MHMHIYMRVNIFFSPLSLNFSFHIFAMANLSVFAGSLAAVMLLAAWASFPSVEGNEDAEEDSGTLLPAFEVTSSNPNPTRISSIFNPSNLINCASVATRDLNTGFTFTPCMKLEDLLIDKLIGK